MGGKVCPPFGAERDDIVRGAGWCGSVRVGADPTVTVHKLHGALVEWY